MARKTEFTDGIDKAIGARINKERVASGLSRQQLAAKIGVTHQQLQKYEYGVNRLTPGRMILIAKTFSKPIAWLFEGVEEAEQSLQSGHKRMCIEVSRNFLGIKNPMHQNAINLLVRTLSEN